MRLWPHSLRWRTILLTLLGLIAVGVSVWWTFRADISAFVKRQQLLASMRKCRHPLDNALGDGELREGMSVEEWAAAHPPETCTRHDRLVTLRYEGTVRRDSLRVVAVDGVIVYAGTEPYDPSPESTLVGSLSPDEAAAYRASILRWSARHTVGKALACGIASTGSRDRWAFPTPLLDDLIEAP